MAMARQAALVKFEVREVGWHEQRAGGQNVETAQTSSHHWPVAGAVPTQEILCCEAELPQAQYSTGQNEGSWLQLSSHQSSVMWPTKEEHASPAT